MKNRTEPDLDTLIDLQEKLHKCFGMMQAAISTSCEVKSNLSLNRKGIGSSPDPFIGGTCNLQLTSVNTREKVWFTRLCLSRAIGKK